MKLEEEFHKQLQEKIDFYRDDEMLSHHAKYVSRTSVSVSANARSSVVDLQMEFVSGPSVSIEETDTVDGSLKKEDRDALEEDSEEN